MAEREPTTDRKVFMTEVNRQQNLSRPVDGLLLNIKKKSTRIREFNERRGRFGEDDEGISDEFRYMTELKAAVSPVVQ